MARMPKDFKTPKKQLPPPSPMARPNLPPPPPRRIADSERLAKIMASVNIIGDQFHARWTWTALHRVNPDLHQRLFDQVQVYDSRCVIEEDWNELEAIAQATVRGYTLAIKVMVEAVYPDDAYMLGIDRTTGLRVVIRERHGLMPPTELEAVSMTPDEVATLLAASRAILSVKEIFPGAVITGLNSKREHEPGENG